MGVIDDEIGNSHVRNPFFTLLAINLPWKPTVINISLCMIGLAVMSLICEREFLIFFLFTESAHNLFPFSLLNTKTSPDLYGTIYYRQIKPYYLFV